MTNARRVLEDLVRQLTLQEEATRPVPEPSPPIEPKRLCIAMSTYEDFDGVYFTVQAIRLFHPEVLDDTSFLVVDNHPEGPTAPELKHFAETVSHMRYVPFRGYRSTAVRDLVFRESDAEIVLCLDSHVLVRPGGLRRLLEYFDAHPTSSDMVQGPLFDDDLSHVVGTHFAPKWGAGMYGQWDTDVRVHDASGEPFEIEMQGLGLFACRRDAWPGINPRFRGFGGEEGYLHEKFRRQGGRVLCLPELAWVHRFGRPQGTQYQVRWLDRIRNYYIGWAEVGWDPAPMEEHFRELLSPEPAEILFSQAKNQISNPFSFFDAIFCLNLDREAERWAKMVERFKLLDIGWRVERFAAIEGEAGCTLSHRAMVAEARRRGYKNILIFEDDAVFLDHTLAVLRSALEDLEARKWDLFYLGGCVWSQSFPYAKRSAVLQRPHNMTCTHAVALNHTAFDRFLAEVPPEAGEGLDTFVAEYAAVDQYLARRVAEGVYKAFVTSPRLATQPFLMDGADADLGLADRYII